MENSHATSEVTGFAVRPMPGPTRWLQRHFWPWVIVPGFLIAGFTGSYIPAVISVAVGLVMTIAVACRVRCPQCKSRLGSREVAETKFTRRLCYDCSTCHVTWESELVNEDD